MIKKTVTYEIADGSMRTKDFYFHLRQVDLMRIELKRKEGFQKTLEKLLKKGDSLGMLSFIEEILADAYGVREENDEFRSDPEEAKKFLKSPAFDALILELGEGDGSKAQEFLAGVIPGSLKADPEFAKALLTAEEAGANMNINAFSITDPGDRPPLWVQQNRDPTEKELRSMTPNQLREAFKQKSLRGRTVPDTPQA